MVIPVVQKKSPPSPSVSSTDSSEIRPQAPDGHLPPTSPPQSPAAPVTPVTDSISDSKDTQTTHISDTDSTHQEHDSFISDQRLQGGSPEKPKTHSRVSSDTAAIITKKTSPADHTVNMRQKQPVEMRASNLFYTPDKPSTDTKQSHSTSRHSLPSSISSTIETNDDQSDKKITVTPPPVAPKPAERRPPSSLPVETMATKSPTEHKSPSVESGKPLVRRTSSNDPTFLRRTTSKSEERISVADAISP